jgi:hypothetical protein
MGLVIRQINMLRLALALCLELAWDGWGSKWQPWLDTLPLAADLPLRGFGEAELALLKGTYFRDLLLHTREDLEVCVCVCVCLCAHQPRMQAQSPLLDSHVPPCRQAVSSSVVGPILDGLKQDPKFRHKDLAGCFERAVAIVASRGFDGMGEGALILPVVDCFDGEVEGGGHNAVMFAQTQLFASRPIAKGELIKLK